MSQNETSATPDMDPVLELRARADALEQRLTETEKTARERVIRAELKAEAVRAGIVDLDGLKLLDLDRVRLAPDGDVENAAELMMQFRQAKPWLFGNASSSSQAIPPPAQPPRQKLATEMSDVEYRAARAAILKHQS